MKGASDDGSDNDNEQNGEVPPESENAGVERGGARPLLRERFLAEAARRGHQSAKDALNRLSAENPNTDQEMRDERAADEQQASPDVSGTEYPPPPPPHEQARPRAKGVRRPQVPTRMQIENHSLQQHVKYEPWCEHCVRASALAKQHRAVNGEMTTVPTVCADFCFMNSHEAKPGDGIPVLVMRESRTRSLFSHACEGKSTSREGYAAYLIEKAVEDIDSVQKEVHLQTDQEPAMLAFQARVQQARRSKTTLRNSPKGDHQANGRAEKGVQVFQNIARRMRLALEGKLGRRLPHKHPVLMWLIEWVGGAHNRFKEGQDDKKTPRERAGWPAVNSVMEFGEVIEFLPFKPEAKMTKFEAKFTGGVWLGLDGRSDEHIIGTSYGVYRASTIKAVPEDRRWNAERVLAVNGNPWDPTPNMDAEDGARVPNPGAADSDVVPKDGEAAVPVVRRMYIRKADVDEHGITDGCAGCRALMLEKPPQNHSPACRERIEGLIRHSESGQARLERAGDRVTAAIVRESER